MTKKENKHKKIRKGKKAVFAALFIVMAIVVGTLIHSLFLKDTADSKPIDNTKVVENETYADVPKDDSTPEDYSPEENIAICQSVMQKMKAWTSKTEGTATADVLFINYTQNINASKVIKDKSAIVQSSSMSTLLSTGQQRVFKDGAILVRNAKKFKSTSDIDWEEDYTPISEDTYAKNYGRKPFSMTNYVIDKNTIISAKILKSNKDTYKFEYELKPDESTVYYKRQMKTEGGASDYPKFHSVKAVVTMDKKWRPVKIHYSENYDINISVVGDVTCQGEITETFSDFEQVKELPNQGKVDEFIKTKYDKNKLSDLPQKDEADVSKYVSDMFKETPYYQIKIKAGKNDLNFNTYIDLENGVIKAQNKDLFLAYANNKVYINYGKIKVSAKADSVFDAINIVSKAVDLDTKAVDFDYLTKLDLNNIDSNKITGLLNDVKLEQKDNYIKVAYKTDTINADIKVSLANENVSLNYANIGVVPDKKLANKLKSKNIKISVNSGKKEQFQSLNNYNDVSKAIALIKPWIKTINSKAIKTNIRVKVAGESLKGNAVLNYKPMAAKFTTKLYGVKIEARIIKNEVYLKTGNIKVKCKINEVESTVKQILELVGVKAGNVLPKSYAKVVKKLQKGNIDVEKLLKKVDKVSCSKGFLKVSAKVEGLKFNIGLSKNTIKLNQKKNLGAKVKIAKKYRKRKKISVKKNEYVDMKQVLVSLKKLELARILKSQEIVLDTDISAGQYKLNGVLTASYGKDFAIKYVTTIEGVPISIIYKDKNIYVTAKNINVVVTEEELFDEIKGILPKLNINLNDKTLAESKSFAQAFRLLKGEYINNINIKDIIGNVETLKYDKGALVLAYKYDGKHIATIKLNNKTLQIAGAYANMDINAKITINNIYAKSPLINVDNSKYSKITDIINVVEKFGVEDLITSSGIDTDVTLDVSGLQFKANVKADYSDKNKIALYITTNLEYEGETIPVEIKYIDEIAYINVENLYVSTDINSAGKVLSEILGEDLIGMAKKDVDKISAAITGISKTPEVKDIICNIESFSCDNNTLKLTYKLNDNDYGISITDRTVEVSGIEIFYQSTKVSAKINNTKSQSINVDNKEKYVDFETAYRIIKANIDKLKKAKGIGADITLRANDNEYTFNTIIDLSEKALKVTVPISDINVDATYINNRLYLEAGNIKVSATKEELSELLKHYIDVGQIDDVINNSSKDFSFSLDMLKNIKEVKYVDSKLKIRYALDDFDIIISLDEKDIAMSIDNLNVENNPVQISGKVTEIYGESQISKDDYKDEEYRDVQQIIDLLKDIKEAPGLTINIPIKDKNLSLVYEDKFIYGDYDGFKLKSDDGSIASIADAVLKIYDVDITPILEKLGIEEDEKDINLDMFKPYVKGEIIDDPGSNSDLKLSDLINNITINDNDITYRGTVAETALEMVLYNGKEITKKPADSDAYIDVSTADSLLKGFGNTATNLNFDITAKATLGLNLGLLKFDLENVPISAKLKYDTDGVYGKIHVDVPYMALVTNKNFDVPKTTTETINETSKTKTEVKTSYSIIKDSQKIETDMFVVPNSIYINKKVSYKLKKTVTTTEYKKIIFWIKQSSKKETRILDENQNFYLKESYKEMQKNIAKDLCFALNFTDSLADKISNSSDNGDVSNPNIKDIFRNYTYDGSGTYRFDLNLGSLTNNALGLTGIDVIKNSDGYLNKLLIDSKLYSVISIKLDADLNNIGEKVDIGFNPEELAKNENYK